KYFFYILFFFFFSSRRRHTRSKRDWSSDVCSSDLIRKLRTNIEFMNMDRHVRTIMVTSSVQREGKSTTIANLGVALARAGRRVALVDLDLRRPYLNRFLKVPSTPGITDVALGRLELSDALRQVLIATPQSQGGRR